MLRVKKILKVSLVYPLIMLSFVVIARPANAGEWRFPVGLGYAGGFDEIADIYENNLEKEGYLVEDSSSLPVGLSFNPYLQFDSGFRVGGGMGPMMLIMGDASHFGLPINLNVGFTFLPKSNVSPYVKVGVSHQIASGDYVEGSDPGLLGAIGVEFLRKKAVGFGFEIGFDKSEVELEKKLTATTSKMEKVRPVDVVVSFYAVF
ncbi:MAG: outer membrane beta-barrel protein [Proteobacteria bacterium]|nr:outer membrane beta-barrel protein [Pseudomonadota bacterium]